MLSLRSDRALPPSLRAPALLQARRWRLALPAFHGDRMRSYGELIRAATEEVIAAWPVDRPTITSDAPRARAGC